MAARPFQPHFDIRIGRSSPFESAARARSAPLSGREKPLDPAGVQVGSSSFDPGLAIEIAARGRSAPLCRSTRPLEPFGGCSNLLLFASAIEVAGRVCSVLWEQVNRLIALGFLGTLDFFVMNSCAKQILANAVVGSRIALRTWLNSSWHRACRPCRHIPKTP